MPERGGVLVSKTLQRRQTAALTTEPTKLWVSKRSGRYLDVHVPRCIAFAINASVQAGRCCELVLCDPPSVRHATDPLKYQHGALLIFDHAANDFAPVSHALDPMLSASWLRLRVRASSASSTT